MSSNCVYNRQCFFLAGLLLVSFFGSFSKSYVLLSPRGSYTWSDAYDNCKANKGYLASVISYDASVKSSSAWIGKVELISKWLQIMGCYVFDSTRGNLFQVPTIADCEMQCSGYKYFAFRAQIEPVCLCMPQMPQKLSNAHSCDSVNTYRFLIVYSRYLRSRFYEKEIGNCMYSSCSTSPMQIDGPYVANCTSSSVRGVCALGEHVEDDNVGWNKSLKDCIEHHGTYFPEDFRNVCADVGSPSWTNIFRENHSFFYNIRSHNDLLSNRIPLKCASVKVRHSDGLQIIKDTHYVECNTRLPYFLCATDSQHLVVNFSQYITSTIANQYTINTNNSIPATNEKDVKNKSQSGKIIGGVVGGIIVLVGICIALLIYIKRPFSICGHMIAKNAPKGSNYSDRASLAKHVEVENQTTKSNYSNTETTSNFTHLKQGVHGHYNKLENGSDVGTGSSFQNVSGHKPEQQGENETSSDAYTSFSGTRDSDINCGSEFDNTTYVEAQRRKQSAASLGSVCDSEFVGYLRNIEEGENETSSDAYSSFSKTTDSDIYRGSEFDNSFVESHRTNQGAASYSSVRESDFEETTRTSS